MSQLEVYIHPTGGPVNGPDSALAPELRAEFAAKYEEIWTT